MNVERLVSSTSDDFERKLLRSAEGEGPSPEAVAKAAATLAGTAALTTTGAATAGGASMAGKALASGALSKVVAMLAPWVAVGVVTGGAVAGFSAINTDSAPAGSMSTPSASVEPPSAVSAASAASVEPPNATPPSHPSTVASQPLASSFVLMVKPVVAPRRMVSTSSTIPSVVAPSIASESTPAVSVALSGPPVRLRSSVTEEVRTIDRTREALASGKPSEALSLLDEYVAKFPHGALSMEAEVLRIEACAAGAQPERAVRLAEAFLESHPAAPHAGRVRSILDAMKKQ